jgi:ribosomal protein S27AE
MIPQILGPGTRGTREFRRHLERPTCPRCGDAVLAAEAATLVARGLVRNSWSCDSCGHDFVTAVRLFPATAAADDLN